MGTFFGWLMLLGLLALCSTFHFLGVIVLALMIAGICASKNS